MMAKLRRKICWYSTCLALYDFDSLSVNSAHVHCLLSNIKSFTDDAASLVNDVAVELHAHPL